MRNGIRHVGWRRAGLPAWRTDLGAAPHAITPTILPDDDFSGRQDAALHGRPEARHYIFRQALSRIHAVQVMSDEFYSTQRTPRTRSCAEKKRSSSRTRFGELTKRSNLRVPSRSFASSASLRSTPSTSDCIDSAQVRRGFGRASQGDARARRRRIQTVQWLFPCR